MAITKPIHSNRVWSNIESLLCQIGTFTKDHRLGRATFEHQKRRIWVSNGAPSGAAPTGMEAGDWILDTTNDEVYSYVTGTTYHQMTATS